MKTTIDLPDETLRAAKVVAAGRGVTLRQWFTEALEEKLRSSAADPRVAEREVPPWMAGFGALSDLASENRRVLATIEAEFERIDPEEIP